MMRLVGHTLLFCRVLHALTDQGFGLRMQHKVNPQSFTCTLTRMVIRRSANAATGKHNAVAIKRTGQGARDALRRIAHVIGPIKC